MDIISNLSNVSIREKGYFKEARFFDAQDMQVIETSYRELIRQAKNILKITQEKGISLGEYYRSSPPGLVVVPEENNRSMICRMEYLLGASKKLKDLVTAKLEPFLAQLVGHRVVLFKDKCNLKLPGGGEFEPHQDFVAYQHFPPAYNITAMIAIDPASVENGCVQFASDYFALSRSLSAETKQFYYGYPVFNYDREGAIVKEISDKLQWEAIPLNTGDVVVFDHFVPHFSSVNKSNASRRAFFITYSLFSPKSWYEDYYELKRKQYNNPIFHVATPTDRND